MTYGQLRRFALALLVAPLVPVAAAIPAAAGDMAGPAPHQKMWLACENGRNYPIRPIAVSRENDLVTGYLVTLGKGHTVHLRHVPMGVGYRYAGRGIWFDGLRREAFLNWGLSSAVACTVEQEQE